MRTYYAVLEENETDWKIIGKFGTIKKAEDFAKNYENKYPSRFSRCGPEYLLIEVI